MATGPFFTTLLHLLGSLQHSIAAPACRCFPDDPCWPSRQQWNEFNATVNGNLIATIPMGSVCHANNSFTTPDPQACEDLLSRWHDPTTHYSTSSSPMSAWWANFTCSPFQPDMPCTSLGPLVRYAVNVTGPEDVQATLHFTRTHNIRLVIRNTGHDYLGKSTGAGAVALWTHHLKSIQYEEYNSDWYTGPALRIGAGVQGYEAMAAAHARDKVLVTGDCQTVGIAGGYTQGGGHGQLASRFGLAADQVVEWEVITASGEILTASPADNADLFWALSGGGGGAYAVVLGAVVKLYPELPTASATLQFGLSSDAAGDSTRRARFWDVVRTFVVDVLPLRDIGGMAIWSVVIIPGAPNLLTFSVRPVHLPGGDKESLQAHLSSTLNLLEEYHMVYEYEINSFPSFYDSYAHTTPWQNITESNPGSRLIPRSTVQENPAAFFATVESILNQTDGSVIALAGITVNVSQKQPADSAGPAKESKNSVHPAWRDAAFALVFGTQYNYTDREVDLRRQRLMTEVITPRIDALNPGADPAAYLNEADWNEPEWQRVLYGPNYGRLLEIKDKYDAGSVFYARTAVGSERWVEREDGRLCRVAK
ncbi:FAD binding domain protein [Aspergillus varians]